MKVIDVDLTVFLEPSVNEMLNHWVDMAKGEVSALGLVEEVSGGFLVTEVFLPEQECSSANTLISPESVAKLLIELEEKGYDPQFLRFWAHSHGEMDVFWSNTDEDTMNLLANPDYVVAVVGNKRGERLARVDIYQPLNVRFNEVPVEIRLPDLGLKDICEQAFKEKVKETAPVYYPIGPADRLVQEDFWWEHLDDYCPDDPFFAEQIAGRGLNK